MDGVLLIDKPRGMTSHDVVDRVRKIVSMRRVGHTGTLDPLASGLLIVCIGRATRISRFLTALSKEYSGTIRLGAISSTYDAEGAIEEQGQPLPKSRRDIEIAMASRLGLRMQAVPPYSAVKVRGKKLYEYARQGEEVPQKHRRVQIHRFEAIDYNEPILRFESRVGSGTYIRSMAHDLGIQLGCGGYLESLRRTSVGSFRVDDALELSTLMESPELWESRILGVAEALAHMPHITITPDAEKALMHGRGFMSGDIFEAEFLPRAADLVLVVDASGKAISIVQGETLTREEGKPIEEAPDATTNGDRPLFFKPVSVLAQNEGT